MQGKGSWELVLGKLRGNALIIEASFIFCFNSYGTLNAFEITFVYYVYFSLGSGDKVLALASFEVEKTKK